MDEMRIVYYYDNDDHTEPKRICSHNCKSYAEFARFLEILKKNEVECWVREDDETIPDEAKKIMNLGAFVDRYYFNFGSDQSLQTLEVILK